MGLSKVGQLEALLSYCTGLDLKIHYHPEDRYFTAIAWCPDHIFPPEEDAGAIQRQIASALDVIIHLGRLRDKSRRVMRIEEITGYEEGRIMTETLYEFREEGMEHETVKGNLVKVGEIRNRDKLVEAGYQEI